jgi:Zn ribbon nucleic-acid-binding protein
MNDNVIKKYFIIRCPRCCVYQRFGFEQLNKREHTECYTCRHCNYDISDNQKEKMLSNGSWVPKTNGEHDCELWYFFGHTYNGGVINKKTTFMNNNLGVKWTKQ